MVANRPCCAFYLDAVLKTTAWRAKSGTNYNRGHTWRDAETTRSSCQTAASACSSSEKKVGVE